MFQTFKKIVACAATGDKSRHFGRHISQFRTFRTMMRTAEENKSEGSIADSIIFWVFLRVEKGLELVEAVVRIKKVSGWNVANLLYDQPP